jgi:alkylation response protein AidB-like acyl-CoA dehydrogenase
MTEQASGTENETASGTWQPQPPALLPPWHTPEREELQLQARRFAMDEVLPVANELDPQKGEIPASLLSRLAELGYFGITVPAEQGGLGLGVFEYCMVSEELARAWMSTASILARSQGLGRQWPTPTAGTNCWPAAPTATGSAPSRCPSPTPAPTWPASPPAPCWTGTCGS